MNRLENKVAIVVGGGQSAGETIGTGRAISIALAREGAKVLVVNRTVPSALETARMANEAAHREQASTFRADAASEADMAAAVRECCARYGRLDVLCYNVGVDITAGDAPPDRITVPAFDAIIAANLRGAVMACKYALPPMRAQGMGSIVTIASLAAVGKYATVAYKSSKAALIAYTRQLAIQNAPFGVRANTILPGTLATPMAVEARVSAWGWSRARVMAERDARTPTKRQGSGWDVAHAVTFLASEEAGFITGVALPVDGGASIRYGGPVGRVTPGSLPRS